MISDEMVEKARKAIADTIRRNLVAFERSTEEFEEPIRAAIEAIAPAIRAAGRREGLEEAAELASGQRAAEDENTRLYLVGYYTAASIIAAAIRALKDTP